MLSERSMNDEVRTAKARAVFVVIELGEAARGGVISERTGILSGWANTASGLDKSAAAIRADRVFATYNSARC